MENGKITGIDIRSGEKGKEHAVITLRHGEPPKPKKGKGSEACCAPYFDRESRIIVPVDYAKSCAVGDTVRVELVKEGRPGRNALKSAAMKMGSGDYEPDEE